MLKTIKENKWLVLGATGGLLYYYNNKKVVGDGVSQEDARKKINDYQIMMNHKAQAYIDSHHTAVGMEVMLASDVATIQTMKADYQTAYGVEWEAIVA